MSNIAAIILCAGKGTRMGSSNVNKVAFDCAGVPVVRRIVDSLRAGGVDRFVIVVGHRAESVMSALDGEDGVLYAYQKDQRGTGHAADCGMRVLMQTGHDGPVLISMGDKLVSPTVVRELLTPVKGTDTHRLGAVLGVLPRPSGRSSKGCVILKEGRALGIIEAKDAQKALDEGRTLRVGGVPVTGDEALASKYVNGAIYCFDAAGLARELKTLKSDNAQGEYYLTDVIEGFATRGELEVHELQHPEEILTYSTKPELRTLAHKFLRTASTQCAETQDPERVALLDAFREKYGDRPCVIASAPGRVNLMGRHIEHRGGSTNMMAIDARTTFVAAPRADRTVRIFNLDPAFSSVEFEIPDLPPGGTADWLHYLDSTPVRAAREASAGHWTNYVKSALFRFQMAVDLPLVGMDIAVSGKIPIAAGLSSSSALVVATAEAAVALNELNLSTREFVDLCGEGEWFVGTRGGQGDHAAMKCAQAGYITHLLFKPFSIGECVPFPSDYAIVVVESGEQAKKAEGARETFNARVADYETALAEIRRHYPELPLTYFRDIAFLPEADRTKALACLTGTVRGVATFGVKECRRAEACVDLLKRGDFVSLGEMMKDSHDGDRLGRGEYECSTTRIDALCDSLNAMEGVLGSQLVGAGLGGCVIALAKKSATECVLADLAASGFKAYVSEPSAGSRVEW